MVQQLTVTQIDRVFMPEQTEAEVRKGRGSHPLERLMSSSGRSVATKSAVTRVCIVIGICW
jgi:hypothetical protein